MPHILLSILELLQKDGKLHVLFKEEIIFLMMENLFGQFYFFNSHFFRDCKCIV